MNYVLLVIHALCVYYLWWLGRKRGKIIDELTQELIDLRESYAVLRFLQPDPFSIAVPNRTLDMLINLCNPQVHKNSKDSKNICSALCAIRAYRIRSGAYI